MTTATGTYFDGQYARGRAVSLECVDAAILRLTGEGLTEEVPLAHLRASDRLGDIPRFVYLPNDAVIETPDNAFVDAVLGTRQETRGARLIHALESQQKIAALACVLLVVAIVALGVYAPPLLARIVARRVPLEIDQRIGAAALITIRPYFRASALGREEQSRVERQLTRLVGKSPAPRLEFRSMNGGLPNAFALPGNIIVMTDELIQLPASDDEIAAVLAHELGHLEKRHGLQSLLRKSFAVLIVAAVTGDLSTLTSFASTIPLTILTAGYSRDLEREADRYALELLRARGIKPLAFTTALVKLEAARARLNRNSTYLSTHPPTDERTALFGGITAAQRAEVVVEPLYLLAASAVARNDHMSAIRTYDRIIEEAPTARAYLLRAKSHAACSADAPAEKDAAKALELDSALAEAHLVRAEVFAFGTKQYAKAITEARAALALDPGGATPLATLGYAEMMAGDDGAAESDLNRAIALAASDSHGWAYRGLLKQRRKDYAGARDDYNQALKLGPQTEWVHLERGIVRNRLRDFSGALADFALVKTTSQLTVEFYFQRGLANQGVSKFDAAIADYSLAFDRSTDRAMRARVQLNRGIAYLANRRYHSALADFDAVIAINPRSVVAYLRRADVHRRMGHPYVGLADLEQALKAGAAEEGVWSQRAHLQWDAGNTAEALSDLNRILEKRVDANALRSRALVYFSTGDWERAQNDLEACLAHTQRRDGEYAQFYRLLVRRHRKLDDLPATFRATIATWPNNWAKSLGRYLSSQITEQQLLAEMRLGPGPSRDERVCEAYFYIGETNLFAGDEAAAREFFEKCIGTGIRHYYEYNLARAELARLDEKH